MLFAVILYLFFCCGIARFAISAEQSARFISRKSKQGRDFGNAIRIQIKEYGRKGELEVRHSRIFVSFFPPFRFQTIFAEKRKGILFPSVYREKERLFRCKDINATLAFAMKITTYNNANQ